MIEVFVHSYSLYMDVNLSREMSQHVLCDPTNATHASELFSPRFKDRMFRQDDFVVLEETLRIAPKTNEPLKIYDLSRLTDKIRAIRQGDPKDTSSHN